MILMGAGCAVVDEDFPIVNKEAEPFEDIYYICTSTETENRIYETVFCGDDSCWLSFYDQNGNLIEKTPELGPGASNMNEPETKVEDCQRTTENYFMSKIEE
ncbi:hypothetical protein A2258_03060 [Candidatus Uhrbacteria bacterium RIFOXYA2_FULL_41_8]|nr:MAG: hypothetical protein A2258_03060 [Candidatus Uhrbacteria bacterium RIFOXYA2_FULL_41_8]